MVADLFLAEWRKLTGNFMLASFTVWVYPIGALAFLVIIGLLLGVTDVGAPFQTDQWTDAAVSPWGVLLRFPGNVMARLPLIAFLAIAFAGEYEWNTWKNIVPRQRRSVLLGAKFVTLAAVICASFIITSVLWVAGRAVIALIYDYSFLPAVNMEVAGEFAQRFVVEIGLAYADVLFLAALTAISALLTRSIVGSLLLGFGLSIVDALSGLIFPLIAALFENSDLMNGYVYTPAYSIDNLRAWLIDGRAVESFVDPAASLAFSIIVLAVWLVVLIGIAMWVFERQDLVS